MIWNSESIFQNFVVNLCVNLVVSTHQKNKILPHIVDIVFQIPP